MTAAVLVTHNAAQWLTPLLDSIQAQSSPISEVIVIDDHSRDGTQDILIERGITVVASASTATGVTRIAQNFQLGVELAHAHEYVILGDHDDIWHVDRVAHQIQVLGSHPLAAMVASDGALIDSAGRSLEGTVRSTFPVDQGWEQWSAGTQLRYALRHSVATGGASALRPARLPSTRVPPGWLHDRWWSLVSLAGLSLVVDRQPVIDYRISGSQQIGLHTGSQQRSVPDRLRRLTTQSSRVLSRYVDLHHELRRLCATPQLREQLSTPGLLRAVMSD